MFKEKIIIEMKEVFKEIPFGIEHTLKVLKNAEDIMNGENIGEEEKEFISIARFAYAQQTGKISLEQFKTLTVFELLDIDKKAHKSKDEDFWANIAYLSYRD